MSDMSVKESVPYLQDLIDYKHNIIKQIVSSQKVIGLLLDDPNIDMESDAAYDVIGNNIYDYDYVDKTVQREDAYIMVETELNEPTSPTMNKWFLYVQVVCSKKYNVLSGRKFKGVRGNRRDNLTLEIDKLLNSDRSFGIGQLDLKNVAPATVPDTFTSTLLVYEVSNFRRERLSGLL